MQTTKIGIRDAKVQLSKLLKLVQQGTEVILTDRGRPVGKIVPIENKQLSVKERLKKLEEKGFVREQSSDYYKTLPSPIPLENNLAQRFLNEDRDSEC